MFYNSKLLSTVLAPGRLICHSVEICNFTATILSQKSREINAYL